ncbi:thioesterase II family protein [Streptomyces sp. SCSIO ZS0520]|uniref:thioesterase II family protein n=1 Tax=Streptomyces sp. SCSIO ZS0520 TaxID=2892996 RepID=UPI0021D86EC7|nr:thioesterase domain-containing protein [Streptomyces sp. SCSIO ZS0520]
MTAPHHPTPAPAAAPGAGSGAGAGVGVVRRPLTHGALTLPRPNPGAAVRLFCFHHAGGSHLLYRGWEAHFPADWELCLLDAPGRGSLLGEPPLDSGARLVDFFHTQLTAWTDRPYALFGHSMGALIAYELTRRLVREGRRPPLWTGLSSCGAPTPRSPRTPGRHEFTDPQLRDWLRTLGATPDEVLDDPWLWQTFAPVFRSDFALVDTWHTAPETAPLPVALSAFGGTEDTLVPRARLAAWARHTRRLHGPHMYSGGHFYLRRHHRSLARRITEAVTAARPTPAGSTPADVASPS